VPHGPGRDQSPGMERLVRLLAVLNAAEHGVPSDRLIEALQAGSQSPEARRKMLDRDLGHLNRLGYDIRNVAEPGAEGVYRMFARDNRLRVLLSPAQRGELLRAVVATGREELAPHLAGEGAALVPAAGRAAEAAVPSQLDRAMRAAARHCRIRFTYKGRPRVVHPRGVHSGPSGWYLAGREEGEELVKEFVVARMTDVALDPPGTADPVQRPARRSLDPLSWDEDPPVEVVLAVPPEHLPVVVTALGEPRTTRTTDDGGALQATYVVTNRAVFRRRVYELGTRVRVVGPRDVRAELLAELTAMAR
jgi:predicted DNA-binding transcriptional regulator YafY